MAKTVPVTIDVPTAKPKTKRPPPKHAFKPGNPYRFVKCGNPKGRPKKDESSRNAHLVSRALRGFLGVKAPYQIAEKIGLPDGASWAQVLGMSLLRRAVSGDVGCARLVLEQSEETRSTLGITDTAGIAPPSLEVFLISPTTGKPVPVTIEGRRGPPPEYPTTPL